MGGDGELDILVGSLENESSSESETKQAKEESLMVPGIGSNSEHYPYSCRHVEKGSSKRPQIRARRVGGGLGKRVVILFNHLHGYILY